jgi:hypothetical protein
MVRPSRVPVYHRGGIIVESARYCSFSNAAEGQWAIDQPDLSLLRLMLTQFRPLRQRGRGRQKPAI